MQPRVPNVALRLLLAEAGWTGTELVRKGNELGAEAGLSLRYHVRRPPSGCPASNRDHLSRNSWPKDSPARLAVVSRSVTPASAGPARPI